MIQPKTMYSSDEDHLTNPVEILYNAIILQAVKDFRIARRKIRRRPDDKAAETEIRELTRFFCSDYFCVLTRLDGPTLLRRLIEENEPSGRPERPGPAARAMRMVSDSRRVNA